jgi:hypothetical protein
VASVATVGDAFPTSASRSEELKGFTAPVDVVTVDWH